MSTVTLSEIIALYSASPGTVLILYSKVLNNIQINQRLKQWTEVETPYTKATKYLFRRYFSLPSGRTPATVRVNGQGFPIQTPFDAIAMLFSLTLLPPAGLSQTQTLHDFAIPLALLMSRLTYTLGWTNQPVVVSPA
jgi:hypothetical protein